MVPLTLFVTEIICAINYVFNAFVITYYFVNVWALLNTLPMVENLEK